VTYSLVVRHPRMAKAARPGQFVIVLSHEAGERIPLTIADFDRSGGTITLVVQTVGKTIKEMPARAGAPALVRAQDCSDFCATRFRLERRTRINPWLWGVRRRAAALPQQRVSQLVRRVRPLHASGHRGECRIQLVRTRCLQE